MSGLYLLIILESKGLFRIVSTIYLKRMSFSCINNSDFRSNIGVSELSSTIISDGLYFSICLIISLPIEPAPPVTKIFFDRYSLVIFSLFRTILSLDKRSSISRGFKENSDKLSKNLLCSGNFTISKFAEFFNS